MDWMLLFVDLEALVVFGSNANFRLIVDFLVDVGIVVVVVILDKGITLMSILSDLDRPFLGAI